MPDDDPPSIPAGPGCLGDVAGPAQGQATRADRFTRTRRPGPLPGTGRGDHAGHDAFRYVPPHGLRAERLLARRRSITAWRDRHSTASQALSALMTEDLRVTDAAPAGLPTEPLAPRPAFGRGDPQRAALASHRAPLPPARTAADRCPEAASSPLDRVELALNLIGDRTCATVSRTLDLPEHTVTARLRAGLSALFAPCDSHAAHSPQDHFSAPVGHHLDQG